jgi:hypothetical protein
MRGLITGRDVVLHAFTIARLWGLPIWLRCLRATLSRRPTTFLAVVHGAVAVERPRRMLRPIGNHLAA